MVLLLCNRLIFLKVSGPDRRDGQPDRALDSKATSHATYRQDTRSTRTWPVNEQAAPGSEVNTHHLWRILPVSTSLWPPAKLLVKGIVTCNGIQIYLEHHGVGLGAMSNTARYQQRFIFVAKQAPDRLFGA